MSQLEFDEEGAKQLESVYLTRDIVRRRQLVKDALDVAPGERILDVGCGPGFYAAELLERVGTDGSLVGIDGSPAMLALAARRCEEHDNVEIREGDATSLPVDDADFDAALCVQVLEYVPDVTRALAEMHRALRPGGRVVVWDIDWSTVSWHSSDASRMERMLRAWDEHLTHPSLPRTLAAQLREVGFEDVAVEGHAFVTTDPSPDSYIGAALPLVEQFVAGREGTDENEVKAWADEQQDLGRRGEFFCTLGQFCFTATRPG
jgi:arsenite methyltransferase